MSGYRSGASTGRLVTKANTAGQQAWTVATFTPGSGTYSAWQEVTSSLDAEFYIVGIHALMNNSLDTFYVGPITVDVGQGGSGAEVTLGTVLITGIDAIYQGSSLWGYHRGGPASLLVPLRVTAGSRIAVRAQCASNGTAGLQVNVLAVPYVNVEGN